MRLDPFNAEVQGIYVSAKQAVETYGNDPGAFTAITEELPKSTAFVRNANLEDLFLKITGRRMGPRTGGMLCRFPPCGLLFYSTYSS